MFSLFLLLGGSFVFGQASEGESSGPIFKLSEKIFLGKSETGNYYYVFNPEDVKSGGSPCAIISGIELQESFSDLRGYGTCFVNDLGTFEIIETSENFSADYSSIKSSEYFIRSEPIFVSGL